MSTPLLNEKHAVIYGDAGRIGHGVAAAYAGQGAHVHLVARTEAALVELAHKIGADYAVFDAADQAPPALSDASYATLFLGHYYLRVIKRGIGCESG